MHAPRCSGSAAQDRQGLTSNHHEHGKIWGKDRSNPAGLFPDDTIDLYLLR